MSTPTRPCAGCQAAAANPLSGLSIDGCQECAVRELAASPAYHASVLAQRVMPAYRQALQRVFGLQWLDGHERVKALAAAVRAARKAAG
ncbi:MAG: hypothetical protein IOD11_07430 [Rhodocyclaceae bacterium]|nr:hypothetical protein [Rhodocyclaceae bacterium]